MSTTIEVSELAERFAEVLAQAGTGNEVIVTEGGVPRARLIAIPPPRTEPRILGLHPGAMQMAPDFDDPLPDEFWQGES
jgi:prevent-host-death family protein